jgi:hypothetical protein
VVHANGECGVHQRVGLEWRVNLARDWAECEAARHLRPDANFSFKSHAIKHKLMIADSL